VLAWGRQWPDLQVSVAHLQCEESHCAGEGSVQGTDWVVHTGRACGPNVVGVALNNWVQILILHMRIGNLGQSTAVVL
jgi:hypothetical protein